MHNIQGARLWSFQDIFALLSKINYERIYQENELQSSGTIQCTFKSLLVWEYLIWPIYSWHAITVTKYNVGLGVTCLCLLVTETISTLCLLEMVSISRLSFLLPTTTLSIRFHTDSPFLNFFFTISLRFFLAITKENCTNVCFLLWKMLASFTELSKLHENAEYPFYRQYSISLGTIAPICPKSWVSWYGKPL